MGEQALQGIQMHRYAEPLGPWSIYFYWRISESKVRARAFCFKAGEWSEDETTASAAGALAAQLAPFRGCITQGFQRKTHVYIASTSPKAPVDIGGGVSRLLSGSLRSCKTCSASFVHLHGEMDYCRDCFMHDGSK